MTDNLKEMVERARAAQKIIEFWPQEKVDEMVLAVGWEAINVRPQKLAPAWQWMKPVWVFMKTKLANIRRRLLGVVRDLQGVKTVGVIEEDTGTGTGKDRQTRWSHWCDHPHDQFILHHALQWAAHPEDP